MVRSSDKVPVDEILAARPRGYELAGLLKPYGVTQERRPEAPDAMILRLNGKRTVVRSHGSNTRMQPEEVLRHLKNLGLAS